MAAAAARDQRDLAWRQPRATDEFALRPESDEICMRRHEAVEALRKNCLDSR